MRSSVNLSSNFLLMGGAVFPPCRLAWGQTIVGVTALMVTSSKRTYTSMLQDCFIRWPKPYSKPLLTHASSGDSRTLTGKSGSISCGVTAPFLNMPAMLENSAVATGLEKASFHSNPNSNVKKCSDYHTIALISHASKVMLKILQARLQQYTNWDLPNVPAGLRKGRGTRHQIANIRWITEKAREFQKSIYFCFIDYAKTFDWIRTNWKFLREMWIPDHLTCLLRNL